MTQEKELRMARKYRAEVPIASRRLRRYNLSDWKLYVQVGYRPLHLGELAGCASNIYKYFFINVGPIEAPAEVCDTVLHEIAHALLPNGGDGKTGHGPRWQRKAREIGASESEIAASVRHHGERTRHPWEGPGPDRPRSTPAPRKY
jgi:hypothetical protein